VLAEVGIDLDKVYLTNVIKVHSPTPPGHVEIVSWTGSLFQELYAIEPGVIVCLGDISGAVVNPDFTTMSKMRGKPGLSDFTTTLVEHTWHPDRIIHTPRSLKTLTYDIKRIWKEALERDKS